MTGPARQADTRPAAGPPYVVNPDTGYTLTWDCYDHRPEVFGGPAPVGDPDPYTARYLTALEDRYVLARACAAAGGDDLGGLPPIREIRNVLAAEHIRFRR